MALTRLQSVLVLILIAVWRVWGESSNLGDSFMFATNETCRDGHGGMELIRVLKTTKVDRFETVANLVGDSWTPEEVYKERIVHQSTSSLILKSLRFNDAGLYEFTCDGARIDGIELTVITPLNVTVTEGQSVKLPCFFFTAGMSDVKLKWTLNGSLVLEQDLSGRISFGSGFNRASVAPDWHLTGDLSLTLEQVQPENQGVFICHVMEEEEEETRGSPGPVRLTVHKNDPHHIISTGPPKGCPTPGAPEESAMGPWTIVSVILNVVLSVAAIVLILWLRSRDH